MQDGFQCWCIACVPDTLIAVPLGVLPSILTSRARWCGMVIDGGLGRAAAYQHEIAQALERGLGTCPGRRWIYCPHSGDLSCE
jgi:hypothetical protein